MAPVHHSRLIASKLLVMYRTRLASHTSQHTPHHTHTHHTTHRKTVEVPLKGFTVIIIGRLSQSKPKLTQLIESLGGRVVSKVTDNTTICISSEGQYDKLNIKNSKFVHFFGKYMYL